MKRNAKDGGFSSPRPEKQDRRMAATVWSNRRKVFAPLGAGGTHCQHDRQQEDYYATHPIAAQQLLKVETFSRNIWECACGDGGSVRLYELLGLIKEVGGVKKFKDLVEAMSVPEEDTVPF